MKKFKLKHSNRTYPVHYGPDIKKTLAVNSLDEITSQPNGLYCCNLFGIGKVYGVKIPKEDLIECL